MNKSQRVVYTVLSLTLALVSTNIKAFKFFTAFLFTSALDFDLCMVTLISTLVKVTKNFHVEVLSYSWGQQKNANASAQPDQSLHCARNRQLKVQCFFMQTAKTLIRLGGYPG